MFREWEANNEYVFEIQESQKRNSKWANLLIIKLKLRKSSRRYLN